MKKGKKIKYTVLITLFLIELISVFFAVKSFSNKDVEEIKQVSKIDRKKFAMFIEQENGEYTESNSGRWPTGNYKLNQEKSLCVDSNGNEIKGILTYNDGVVYVTSKKTIFCYVYFDILNDITITVSTNDISGVLPNTGGYKATLSCDTATGKFNEQYQRIEISSISSDDNNCNLEYNPIQSSYTLLKTEVERKANTNANGYRYSGKTPDNYIWFNNEMWRMIGSIPTCTSSGCATSENLVKIIRNESIGNFAYDAKSTDYTGVWGNNTLYSILNTNFYASSKEKLNGQDHEGCYRYKSTTSASSDIEANCNFSRVGILSTSYYGRMVKQVYWNTGTSAKEVTAGTAYTNEITKQTVEGYIGLMTLSDYGYAASSTYHSTFVSDYTGDPASNNWLFNYTDEYTSISGNYLWGISMDIGNFYTRNSGYIDQVNVLEGAIVRPVLYLDSDVYIVSGSGAINDPYIIGM